MCVLNIPRLYDNEDRWGRAFPHCFADVATTNFLYFYSKVWASIYKPRMRRMPVLTYFVCDIKMKNRVLVVHVPPRTVLITARPRFPCSL